MWYFFETDICHDIQNIRRLYISDSIVAVYLTVILIIRNRNAKGDYRKIPSNLRR